MIIIITEAFTDGGQMISVLSYFANRVPTQVQFPKLGPVTQHFLQLLQTHKAEKTPQQCFWLVVLRLSPGNDSSVNAAVHAIDFSEANMMHIYGITNQRQTRGEPLFQGTLHERGVSGAASREHKQHISLF